MKNENRINRWFLKSALLIAGCVWLFGSTSRVEQPVFFLGKDQDPQEQKWVDSVYNAMTEDERLGQLFMIRAHSDLGDDHVAKVEALIRKYQVGSLCFFQGTPEKQIELINRYQQLTSHVPLLMAIDGEWGLGMRMINSTISYPRHLTLGAIQDNDLIYEMGEEIGYQLRRVGIHVNFAPVVDINNNPKNPVINTRSFGEDRFNVTAKSYQYMKGMQDNGVLACLKHFPGHGDTDVDSHYDLPVILHDRDRLDSLELYPFRQLAREGAGSVMVAHLSVPALDDRENRPTTLSRHTVTNLLQEEIGFEGLIFTDALEMKGVTKHYRSGQVEAEALLAGNDVLVLPEDLEAAVLEIRQYLADGRIDPQQVAESVKKMLRAKYRLGLTRFTPIPVEGVREELNRPEAVALKYKLIQHALTLVRNKDNLLPFQELDTLQLASLSIGASSPTLFQQRLNDYQEMPNLQSGKEISPDRADELIRAFKDKDAVIVGIHGMSSFASKDYGLTPEVKNFLARLNRETKVVLVLFGTPYSLKYFDEMEWTLVAYEEDEVTQDLAAQALFGVFSLRGRLPVTASPTSPFNTGIITPKSFRFGYMLPENVGMSSDTLKKIDRIAEEAIREGATPGCVVLVAKDGKIVYHKAFGHHTYEKGRAVRTDDLYDLASVTKIASATLAVMKLQEQGLIDIDEPLKTYLPELASNPKGELTLREVMSHRAGLTGWIPFYKQTLTAGKRDPQPLPEFYSNQPRDGFSVPVTESLYLKDSFVDSIWQQIRDSELSKNRNYKYSDLGFYWIAEIVGRITGKPINEYLQETFYQPLGLKTATYLPWQKYPLSRIVPTEKDRYFRKQMIHGYVHDMGAAMLGGVSGHAGLFSDALDLAILMQMLMQQGYYGYKQWLQPETIEQFTTRLKGSSRRGIGFDMRQTNPLLPLNDVSSRISNRAFGHSGFTGVCAWADPDYQLVYVFLSNRTYPSMNNYRLNRLEIRERIQTVIYRSMNRNDGNTREIAGKSAFPLPLGEGSENPR